MSYKNSVWKTHQFELIHVMDELVDVILSCNCKKVNKLYSQNLIWTFNVKVYQRQTKIPLQVGF